MTAVFAKADGLHVTFEGPDGVKTDLFDKLLCAVGRKPNGKLIVAEAAGIAVDERGYIAVDKQMRTECTEYLCDWRHRRDNRCSRDKAVHEGHVAAEVACGMKSVFDARVIPSVAYTDPEVAWVEYDRK